MVDDHNRTHDFTGDASTGSKVDAGELNTLLDKLFNKDNEQNDFAEIIQRDDGELRDAIVRLRSLHPETLALIADVAGFDEDVLIGIIDAWLKGLTPRGLGDFTDTDELLIRAANGDWQKTDLECLAAYICAQCTGVVVPPALITDPPLDNAGIVGEFQMYSVRLLRTSYLGPLFRIRRGSDDAELDLLPNGTTNRVEVAQLEAFQQTPADSIYAVRFYNQYGLANPSADIFQTNVYRQPLFTDPAGGIYTTPNGYLTWARDIQDNQFLQTDNINNPSAQKGFCFVYTAVSSYGNNVSLAKAGSGGWQLRTADLGGNNWVYEVNWDSQTLQSNVLPFPEPIPAKFEALGFGMTETFGVGYRNGFVEGLFVQSAHGLGIHTQKWGDNATGGSLEFKTCEMIYGSGRNELELLSLSEWLVFQQNQIAVFGDLP